MKTSPVEAVDSGLDAGQKAFLWCLRHLARARRGDRHAYTEPWQSVTDTQAAMAACWTLRLWMLWKQARPWTCCLPTGSTPVRSSLWPMMSHALSSIWPLSARTGRPCASFSVIPVMRLSPLRNDGHFEFSLAQLPYFYRPVAAVSCLTLFMPSAGCTISITPMSSGLRHCSRRPSTGNWPVSFPMHQKLTVFRLPASFRSRRPWKPEWPAADRADGARAGMAGQELSQGRAVQAGSATV